MPYLGTWAQSSVVTIYLQTASPNTASAVDADSLPIYRVYHDAGASAHASGTFALLDASNTDGFYAAQFTLSTTHGFSASGAWCVRKQATVCAVTAAQLDTFRIYIS